MINERSNKAVVVVVKSDLKEKETKRQNRINSK